MKLLLASAATSALLLASAPAFAFGSLTFVTGSANSNNTGSVHSILSGNVTIAANTFTIFSGDIIGLNASTDAVSITDAAANPWVVRQCPVTSGSTNVSWVAYSQLPNGLSAQKVTLADTTNAGTVNSSSGAMWMWGFTLTGVATSSPEDIAASACQPNGSGATTAPIVVSNAPAGAGEFFFTNYAAAHTSTSFTYTADTANGWGNVGVNGTTRQITTVDSQTNAGSGAKTDAPTTTSTAYAMQTVVLCPTGGCSVAAVTSHNLSSAGAGQ